MSSKSNNGSDSPTFKQTFVEKDKMSTSSLEIKTSSETRSDREKARDDLKVLLISAFKQNNEIRQFLLELEKIFIAILENMSPSSNYIHPPVDSYKRMLVHKLAEYYQLGHLTDTKTNQVFVYPLPNSSFHQSLSELCVEYQSSKNSNSKLVKKILINPNKKVIKRYNKQSQISQFLISPQTSQKSLEERKNSYIQARSRILGVSIEECEAQFKNFDLSVFFIINFYSTNESNSDTSSSDNLKVSFLNKIHDAALNSKSKDSSEDF